MAGIVDLGITFEDANITIPDGTHKFQIDSVDDTQTKEQRPMWTFWLSVVESPDPKVNGQRLPYNCPLPYADAAGKLNTSGLGLLTSLFKAIGKTWTGTQVDPNSLIGETCYAEVAQTEWQGEKRASIKKFVRR